MVTSGELEDDDEDCPNSFRAVIFPAEVGSDEGRVRINGGGSGGDTG